ncbi:MAG: tetratricopeptide repeat protein, partial [Thermoplasmata archaeon]|nr:tetratricopeptide repeat protein [Thermoplasmata archaeon]
MAPNKKRFTEDFMAKWSKSSVPQEPVDPKAELTRIRELLQKDPKNPKYWFDYGQVHLSLGNSEEAWASFARSENLGADWPNLYLALALSQTLRGKAPEAADRFLQTLKTHCEEIGSPYLETVSIEHPIEEIRKDVIREDFISPEEQLKAKALTVLKEVPGIGNLKAEALYEAGFRNVEDLKEATVDELAEIEGLGMKSAQKIKIILTFQDRLDSKSAELQEMELPMEEEEEEFQCPLCSTILSVDEEVCYECGMQFDEKDTVHAEGELDSELTRLNGLVQQDPNDIESLFALGNIQFKLGQLDEAMQSLNGVTRLNMAHPGVWALKADIFTKQGEHEKAANCYKRAAEIGPMPEKAVVTKVDSLLDELEDMVTGDEEPDPKIMELAKKKAAIVEDEDDMLESLMEDLGVDENKLKDELWNIDEMLELEDDLSSEESTEEDILEEIGILEAPIIDAEEQKRLDRCNKMLGAAKILPEDKAKLELLIPTGISAADFTSEIKNAIDRKRLVETKVEEFTSEDKEFDFQDDLMDELTSLGDALKSDDIAELEAEDIADVALEDFDDT